MPVIVLLGVVLLITMTMMSFIIGRYKKVPANKVLVIYGKTETGEPIVLTNGAQFVWPVIQDFAYLDLTPIRLDVNLKGVRNRNKELINVFSKMTVAISKEEDLVMEAANRFLDKKNHEIGNLALDIAKSQLKRDIANMDIEDFNDNWDATSGFVEFNINKALNEIGLVLINMTISDIQRNTGNITEFK